MVQGGTTGGASRAVFAAGVEGVTRTRGVAEGNCLQKGTVSVVGDFFSHFKVEEDQRRK